MASHESIAEAATGAKRCLESWRVPSDPKNPETSEHPEASDKEKEKEKPSLAELGAQHSPATARFCHPKVMEKSKSQVR